MRCCQFFLYCEGVLYAKSFDCQLSVTFCVVMVDLFLNNGINVFLKGNPLNAAIFPKN